MSILIAYAGKTGTSRRCAQMLSEQLPGSTVADLYEQTPDPAAFDAVILGGCIRAGQVRRPLRRYIDRYPAVLSEKPLGLFLCCTGSAQAEKYFRDNFPPYLFKFCRAHFHLGGDWPQESLRGADRLVARIAQHRSPAPGIIEENIRAMAQAFAPFAGGAYED